MRLRPSGSYYSPRSYGTTPSYSSYNSYSKPSYTPSSSKYGSSYITPSREKSVDRTGYTSDYGKSGYTSDYGKSGYASDRNRVGYTSDYNAKPSSNYSSYNNPSSYGYGRSVSRQNSITGTDRLSRQNSLTGSESLSRQNSISGSLSRQNSVTGRDSLYRRDSYGVMNNLPNSNYGGYSRSQSREEVTPKVNGLANSDSKSRVNCKAPADFTTDESESEEEETESDSSDLEPDETIMVTRGTSPVKEITNGTSSNSNKIATTSKEKIKIDPMKFNRSTSEISCQVNPEEFPPKRERFISSRPTSLYLNKYYPSSASSRYSVPSSRSFGSSNTEVKSPESTSKPPLGKQQLSVDEPASAGGFSRDASPNERQTEEPNKDFRKSVLNMNVDDKLKDEYGRRQEEMRRHRRRTAINNLSTEQQQQSSSASPSSSEDDNHLPNPEQDKKRKVLKKSPSRSGILSKCGSRSKMEAGVKKSASHARVQRRVRDDNSEKRASSSSSSSSSSESEEDNKRSRTRQRWRATRSSTNDTEDTNNDQQESREDAPALIVHSPAETSKSDNEDSPVQQNLGKIPSNGSSDLTSPGEVVHLTFPPRKAPQPLERVDSGRNVAVSVDITDFLKPKSAAKKKSSTSSSEEESGSLEE
ncbi:RNase H domain-containing protein, partial [Trichonephila clavata]